MPRKSDFANDPLIAPLLPGYLARLAENIAVMRTLWAAGDAEGVRKIAHQLKGAGASYGFPGITEFAARLEAQILAAKNLSTAAPEWQQLQDYLNDIDGYRAIN